ncbi:retrotransposon hot spot (RHS) protein, partial [Trypanosoma conorhini]
PKRTRARAEESPATNVPRGRRHARSGPDGGASGQPPAQRRRVEEAPAGPQWNLTTAVEEVLLAGFDVTEQMTLNDFIRRYVDPDFVLEGRNVMMGVFARRPEHYIRDEWLLGEILNSQAYQLLEDARNLRADARNLAVQGVSSLDQWKEFEHKDTVTLLAKGKLDRALAVAKRAERSAWIQRIVSQPLPEGFYNSVLNAKWSHVLGFPEGEGDAMVVRMEVRQGQTPTQLWDYRRKGISYEPVEDALQFIAPRPRLLVLTSEKGWPYSLKQRGAFADCYINYEVERVWRIVKGDLEGEFGTADLKGFDVRRRLLIGTPGIGKSMAAGSYLLYRLLHYDIAKLQVVVYCFGGDLAFVFDKEEQTVTAHGGELNVINVMNDLVWQRKLKGYVIYDVDKKGEETSKYFPPHETWGIIVLSSPNETNYKGWEKQMFAKRIIMNCPDELDVKAMCVWERRVEPAEAQAERWETVKKVHG